MFAHMKCIMWISQFCNNRFLCVQYMGIKAHMLYIYLYCSMPFHFCHQVVEIFIQVSVAESRRNVNWSFCLKTCCPASEIDIALLESTSSHTSQQIWQESATIHHTELHNWVHCFLTFPKNLPPPTFNKQIWGELMTSRKECYAM
jgi:hypothetical protein